MVSGRRKKARRRSARANNMTFAQLALPSRVDQGLERPYGRRALSKSITAQRQAPSVLIKLTTPALTLLKKRCSRLTLRDEGNQRARAIFLLQGHCRLASTLDLSIHLSWPAKLIHSPRIVRACLRASAQRGGVRTARLKAVPCCVRCHDTHLGSQSCLTLSYT